MTTTYSNAMMNSSSPVAYMDNDCPSDEPHSPLRTLHSPAYSIYSNGGEYYHTCSESASSMDGSSGSQLPSEKFQLGGIFSSFDEDSNDAVSDDENRSLHPIPQLKSLNEQKHFILGMINSQNNDVITVSSDDDTPTHAPPTHIISPSSLIVNVPLNLVTLNLQWNNHHKKPPVNLALSHFSKKIVSSIDSINKTPPSSIPHNQNSLSEATPHTTSSPSRTSISLKLKRSPISNQWQAITPLTTDDVINDTSAFNRGASSTVDSNEGIPSSNNEQDTCIVSPEKTCVYENEIAKLPNTYVSSPIDSPWKDPSPIPESCDMHLILLSSDTLSSSDNESIHESVSSLDTTLSSNSSSSASYSTSSDENMTLSARNNRKRLRHSTQRQTKFSFLSVFSSIPQYPQLTVTKDGILSPVQSLSTKGTVFVPASHPIHNWRIGRRVDKKAKKQSKNRMP